jgi:molybdopterin-guanine dinucleotide biosynthesis protein A
MLGAAVGPVAVVTGATARTPDLPPDVRIVFDRRPQRGPLEGLAVGLAALAGFAAPEKAANSESAPARIAAAYVTSCDTPLLLPAFIRRMTELLDSADVAVPKVNGRLHPLAAVYRLAVLPQVEGRLAADQLRLTGLVEDLDARIVEPEELSDVDPHLLSIRNVNNQEEYRAALAAAASSLTPYP